MTLNERIALGIYEWRVEFLNPRMGYRKVVQSDNRSMAGALDGARDLLAFAGYNVGELTPISVTRGALVRPLDVVEAFEIEDAASV